MKRCQACNSSFPDFISYAIATELSSFLIRSALR
jgi:hypothetical protein